MKKPIVKIISKNVVYIEINGETFLQSYDSIVAGFTKDGRVVFEDYDYSRTTMKSVIRFFNKDSISKIRKLIKSGDIKLLNTETYFDG